MECPTRNGFISRDLLHSNYIEANDEFTCPTFKEELGLIEDGVPTGQERLII